MIEAKIIPNSSSVEWYAYDHRESRLAVRFKQAKNMVYIYTHVSALEWKYLQQTESVGTAISKNIKPNHDVHTAVAGSEDMAAWLLAVEMAKE